MPKTGPRPGFLHSPLSCRPGGPVVVVPEVNKDVHRQLVGAAANLNQIAIKLNLGEKAASTLAAVIGELRAAAMLVQGKAVSTK